MYAFKIKDQSWKMIFIQVLIDLQPQFKNVSVDPQSRLKYSAIKQKIKVGKQQAVIYILQPTRGAEMR